MEAGKIQAFRPYTLWMQRCIILCPILEPDRKFGGFNYESCISCQHTKTSIRKAVLRSMLIILSAARSRTALIYFGMRHVSYRFYTATRPRASGEGDTCDYVIIYYRLYMMLITSLFRMIASSFG